MISILSICGNPEILSILRIVKLALNVLMISVPILLVLSLSIEFFKALTSHDELSVKKAFHNSIPKIVAGLCVLFVPTAVNIVVNVMSIDTTYKTCLDNATVEKIQAAYNDRAKSLVESLKDNLDEYTLQKAISALENMEDGEEKNDLQREIENIKKVVEAKKLIEKVRISKSDSDYQKAVEAVEKIEDKNLKKQLEEELEKISLTMNEYVSDYSSEGNYIANTLGLPHYQQCDSRWGNIKYDIGGGPNGGMATLCSSSCGYTSFSMIAAGLNRDFSITPPTVVSKMRNINIASGEYTKRGYGAASVSELTNPSYMSYYKLTAKTLTGSGETLRQNIMKELNTGHAVLILVPGHYMTLAPSNDPSKVVLLDPFSNWADSRRGSKTTTIESVWNIYSGITYAISYKK